MKHDRRPTGDIAAAAGPVRRRRTGRRAGVGRCGAMAFSPGGLCDAPRRPLGRVWTPPPSCAAAFPPHPPSGDADAAMQAAGAASARSRWSTWLPGVWTATRRRRRRQRRRLRLQHIMQSSLSGEVPPPRKAPHGARGGTEPIRAISLRPSTAAPSECVCGGMGHIGRPARVGGSDGRMAMVISKIQRIPPLGPYVACLAYIYILDGLVDSRVPAPATRSSSSSLAPFREYCHARRPAIQTGPAPPPCVAILQGHGRSWKPTAAQCRLARWWRRTWRSWRGRVAVRAARALRATIQKVRADAHPHPRSVAFAASPPPSAARPACAAPCA